MWTEADKCVDCRRQCTIKIAKTAFYTAVALLVIILERKLARRVERKRPGVTKVGVQERAGADTAHSAKLT